ncbi:MAG: hypothetical protein Kow00128_21660 [Deltaproteobacteria bacterium]
MKPPVLSVGNLYFRYGERTVLSGVTLDLREGEVAVLLGPNGAGKSTLLRICSGLLSPESGEVRVAGLRPDRADRREMARTLSVVGQELPVEFPMSVEEFVTLGRFPHHGFFGSPTAVDREHVERALERTGLVALRDRGLGEISAGERQRAAVARGIAQGAKVMLLDEPTAYLDIYHRVAFYEIVTELARTGGIGALVASHDLSLCAEYADRIVLLAEGRVLSAGRPGEVLTPERIRAAYGVEAVCDRNPETGSVRVTPLRRR